MSTVTARQIDQSAAIGVFDQYVRLRGASWADYERLLQLRGDSSVPRITYLQGELELMSPSSRHERVAEMIAWLLGVWTYERGIVLESFGTTTWKDEATARGAEADKSFVLSDETKPRPDLVLEVVVTSGGIDKLEIYRKLGVPEVWFWHAGSLTAHVLRGDHYRVSARSVVLPDVDLDILARLAKMSRARATGLLLRLLRRR